MNDDAKFYPLPQRRRESRLGGVPFIHPSLLCAAGAGAIAKLSNRHVFLFTALLFLAPNALFAVSALRPGPALAVLAGCAGVGLFLRQSFVAGCILSAPLDPPKLALSLSVSLALCILGGQGHFFYANYDWLLRDAVLADLVRYGTMPLYQYDGQDHYLRAPLGMYMLPAAVGRTFGLFPAHLALLSANAIIFGFLLYLASILSGARTFVFLAVLIAFSGLDLVGALAAEVVAQKRVGLELLEWWSRAFAPSLWLQYSSNVTQLFWVPNHAAPGWFIAILALLRARAEIRFSTFLACCAPLILWSPLAVLGALPIGVSLVLRMPIGAVLTAENLFAVATGLSFLPIALYLLSAASVHTHGWQSATDEFGGVYMLFLLIELPQTILIVFAWRKIEPVDRSTLVTAFMTLFLLPFYAFGPSNDLLLRASIPSLFLVAFSFARVAASMGSDNRIFRIAVFVIILLSAVTPASQALKALDERKFAVSDCNMLTAWQSIALTGFPSNYLVPRENISDWLLDTGQSRTPARLEYRDCWPDHPHRDILRKDRD